MNCRTDVVPEARQSQLCRSQSATNSGPGLDQQNAQALSLHRYGSGKTIGPRTYHNCIEILIPHPQIPVLILK
jgi:hypothetical protein